ncbi:MULTISPECIES: hypothetical protein [Sorangium]|uniref:hypothetical protein n=1 Tax=Sorangium TaxID=39643 RepID=UPI0013ED7A97|nr:MULTISPECIES: hypothetical protein [Sorangium]
MDVERHDDLAAGRRHAMRVARLPAALAAEATAAAETTAAAKATAAAETTSASGTAVAAEATAAAGAAEATAAPTAALAAPAAAACLAAAKATLAANAAAAPLAAAKATIAAETASAGALSAPGAARLIVLVITTTRHQGDERRNQAEPGDPSANPFRDRCAFDGHGRASAMAHLPGGVNREPSAESMVTYRN